MQRPKLVKDIAGQKFNALTAIEYAGSHNGALWRFSCDCGGSVVARSSMVSGGRVRSCGCLSVATRFKPSAIRPGMEIGGILVLQDLPNKGRNKAWLCRCSCGVEFEALGGNIVSGNTKSCGCRRRKVSREKATKHGGSGTRTFNVWNNMIRRCCDPQNDAYKDYGGRGITVCERWMDFEGFRADMGEAPRGRMLDRINNNGNYDPGNCRWATSFEQARNTRSNALVTIGGETKCIAEWAEQSGIPASRIWARKNKLGWKDDDLLRPHAYRGHG